MARLNVPGSSPAMGVCPLLLGYLGVDGQQQVT